MAAWQLGLSALEPCLPSATDCPSPVAGICQGSSSDPSRQDSRTFPPSCPRGHGLAALRPVPRVLGLAPCPAETGLACTGQVPAHCCLRQRLLGSSASEPTPAWAPRGPGLCFHAHHGPLVQDLCSEWPCDLCTSSSDLGLAHSPAMLSGFSHQAGRPGSCEAQTPWWPWP